MDTTTLQVPLTKSLKSSATTVAKEIGFSSLQDFVRLVLTKLAHRELTVDVTPAEYIKLSPAAKRRYDRIRDDIEHGRNIVHVDNPQDFLAKLRS